MRILFSLLGVAVLVSSCKQHSGTSYFDDTVINRPGSYPLSSGERLEITVASDKIVNFRLLDARGLAQLQSTERASDRKSWELYWDSSGARLWFNSSDVGMTVWAKDASGHYTQTWISDETPTWAAKMPKVFFDALPTNLQQQWAPLRVSDR